MTCRFNSLPLLLASGALPSPAFAGHAGQMDSPGFMSHELLAGLIGLAGMLLLTILALAWVIWRLRGLEKTQQD